MIGKVVEQGSGSIYIDDGSDCYAGGTHSGLKVITSAVPGLGELVAVNGISACEIPAGEAEPVRLVRAVTGGVQVLN